MALNEWAILLLTILVAVCGLVVASSADGATYTIGLIVTVAAVVYGFFQIKRYFDRVDAGRH